MMDKPFCEVIPILSTNPRLSEISSIIEIFDTDFTLYCKYFKDKTRIFIHMYKIHHPTKLNCSSELRNQKAFSNSHWLCIENVFALVYTAFCVYIWFSFSCYLMDGAVYTFSSNINHRLLINLSKTGLCNFQGSVNRKLAVSLIFHIKVEMVLVTPVSINLGLSCTKLSQMFLTDLWLLHYYAIPTRLFGQLPVLIER